MKNYEKLLHNIRRYVQLTEEEEAQLKAIIRTTLVKKRQFIIQPGFPCRHRSYIVEGAFRVYFLDRDGKEHTVSIAVEDWFVSDFYSYITQTPPSSSKRTALSLSPKARGAITATGWKHRRSWTRWRNNSAPTRGSGTSEYRNAKRAFWYSL